MNTLNILLTTGKMYNKQLLAIESPQYATLQLILKENIPIKDIQSIWVHPEPIQITLESLELT